MSLTGTNVKTYYPGPGGTVFPTTFKVFASSEVVVQKLDQTTDEVVATLALDTDYTIAGVGNPAATVTLNGDLGDYALLLRRVTVPTQTKRLPDTGAFYPSTVENALDLATATLQEHDEQIARSIKLKILAPLGGVEINPTPGYALGFDADGNVVPVANTGADQTLEWTAADAVVAADAAAATALVRSDLASNLGATLLGYLAPFTGAVLRTLSQVLGDFHITPGLFGAVGNGVADDTVALRAAVVAAITTGKVLEIPAGKTFLVNTFDQALDSATNCAFKVTGDLVVVGRGTIKSTTSTVTNAIFGLDATSGEISFDMDGVKFAGTYRYRAVCTTSASLLSVLRVVNVEAERQSLVLTGDISRFVEVCSNKLGTNIGVGTAVSPSLNVTMPAASTGLVGYRVNDNMVWTGTEVISTGAYVIHGIPPGGECIGNTHFNVGPADNEGFDIDNLGRFGKFCGNTSWGAGFEYKTGTEGYSDNRDFIFSDNISYSSWHYGFAIQSSCIGSGNIAYNPATYGIYMTPNSDVDSLLPKSHILLKGFKIVYAGATWVAGFRMIYGTGYKTVTLEDVRFELDPAWDAANPGSAINSIVIDIDGDVNDLVMRNIYLDRHTLDGVNFRPTTTANRLLFENFRWGGAAGDSCFDLANCNNVVISNPVFPSSITDRPVRLATCNAVRIYSDFHPLLGLAQTSGTNTGVLINNWGVEAAGAATPPSATSIWPQGCIVRNSSDSTIWLRVSESSTPATAWKQIA